MKAGLSVDVHRADDVAFVDGLVLRHAALYVIFAAEGERLSDRSAALRAAVAEGWGHLREHRHCRPATDDATGPVDGGAPTAIADQLSHFAFTNSFGRESRAVTTPPVPHVPPMQLEV